MFEYHGLKLNWLGHDCFKIKDGKTIYVDPFRIMAGDTADIVFITHEHYDHLSPEDIRKITSHNTIIVAPISCRTVLSGIQCRDLILLEPGDKRDISGVEVKTIPAYNTNKFREPGILFHPREDGKLGYLITENGVRLYHSGDTDQIPEMRNLDVDIALLPVSGIYVMTAEEAAEAVIQINPKVAIPMHYGSIVGDERDARLFERIAPCRVCVLEKE